MDKVKILRQCNEIERAVNELYVKRQDSITREERIALINMLGVIVAEITAPPKSNADRIRQMTDEELAKFMCLVKDKLCFGCSFSHVDECEGISCEEARKKWLKQEVTGDAEAQGRSFRTETA